MTDTMRDRLRRWGQLARLGLLFGLLFVGCDSGVQGSSPPPNGAIDAGRTPLSTWACPTPRRP